MTREQLVVEAERTARMVQAIEQDWRQRGAGVATDAPTWGRLRRRLRRLVARVDDAALSPLVRRVAAGWPADEPADPRRT